MVLALLLASCTIPSFCFAQGGSGKAAAPGAAAPAAIADYRSPHFLVHTDLSALEAKELLIRLERMLKLVSGYWGKPPVGVIECFVVKDLKNWPEGSLEPAGLASIASGGGLTITDGYVLGQKVMMRARVFSGADHGTPQHEAVHAYCGQTFGSTGPVWYSEGMAEMGNYWIEGEKSVKIHEGVLEYLQKSKPQTLAEIVNANSKQTGDSWQNYAWRWALCHLLANNPNYSDRFRPLGLALLAKQPGASFEQTYGSMAREIQFEYSFFLKHLSMGYRVDLCAWDWKKKFVPLKGAATVSSKINSAQGWQASSATVAADTEYEYSATGAWALSKAGKAVNADGEGKGEGRLMGVILEDFTLSEPFELGAYGTFTPPSSGKLYLRCQDAWNELADNKGMITVRLKPKGGPPLPKPPETTSTTPTR